MTPDIPSFKKGQNEEKEDKGGASPLPGSKSGAPGSKPLLRVRGLSGTGASVMERLKQFKKKDLAFILSGLGVLFMAPVAEHFILGPGDESKAIRPGFDSKTGNTFNDAGVPYEPGAGGLSPGGLPGGPQGSDVITPLNARDPSSLIMGPGATQQPSATVTPPAAPPSSSSSDKGWGDVVKDSARSAGRSAMDAAGPAMPHGSLSGSLRGLSALSGASYGGGGGGGGMAPISASNVPNHGGSAGRSFSLAGAAPGYKGVASRSESGNGSSIEALRAAAAGQGGAFNRASGAANSLNTAANETMPNGGGSAGGGGGPGGGESNKANGNNSVKDNKSLGESLAYLKAKMEMEKAVDLEWKEKEWYQFGRSKMIQETLIKGFLDNIVGKGLEEPMSEIMSNAIEGLVPGAGGSYSCKGNNGTITIPKRKWLACCKGTPGKDSGGSSGECQGWSSGGYCIQANCSDAGDGSDSNGNPNSTNGQNDSHDAQKTVTTQKSPVDAQRDKDLNDGQAFYDTNCAGANSEQAYCKSMRAALDASGNLRGADGRTNAAKDELTKAQTNIQEAAKKMTDSSSKKIQEVYAALGGQGQDQSGGQGGAGVFNQIQAAKTALAGGDAKTAAEKLQAAKDELSTITEKNGDSSGSPCVGSLGPVCSEDEPFIKKKIDAATTTQGDAKSNIDSVWTSIAKAQTGVAASGYQADDRWAPSIKAEAQKASDDVSSTQKNISPVAQEKPNNGTADGNPQGGTWADVAGQLERANSAYKSIYGKEISTDQSSSSNTDDPASLPALKAAITKLQDVQNITIPSPNAANSLNALVGSAQPLMDNAGKAVQATTQAVQALSSKSDQTASP